jgi:hypothetical protein
MKKVKTPEAIANELGFAAQYYKNNALVLRTLNNEINDLSSDVYWDDTGFKNDSHNLTIDIYSFITMYIKDHVKERIDEDELFQKVKNAFNELIKIPQDMALQKAVLEREKHIQSLEPNLNLYYYEPSDELSK